MLSGERMSRHLHHHLSLSRPSCRTTPRMDHGRAFLTGWICSFRSSAVSQPTAGSHLQNHPERRRPGITGRRDVVGLAPLRAPYLPRQVWPEAIGDGTV